VSVRTDKIYLVGFMGAGKSTVARVLGQRLGWPVEDVDVRIEAREGRTVADIFAQDGEPYFRSVERIVLQDLLEPRHVVVATGGGTFVDPANSAAINADGASVWLDVGFDEVIARLPSDGRRPLASDRASLRALYDTRRVLYTMAHHRLDAGQPVEAMVERLMDWVGF
jgi:shikimate kinase